MRLSQAIVPVTPTNGLASNAPDGLALKLSVELLGPEAHEPRSCCSYSCSTVSCEAAHEQRKNDPQLDTNAVKDQSSMSEPIRVEGKKEDKSMDQHFSQQILDMLFLQRMWRSCCFRPDFAGESLQLADFAGEILQAAGCRVAQKASQTLAAQGTHKLRAPYPRTLIWWCREVPGRCRPGAGEAPGKLQEGSAEAPQRLRGGPGTHRGGTGEAPITHRSRKRRPPRRVPAGSRPAPAPTAPGSSPQRTA